MKDDISNCVYKSNIHNVVGDRILSDNKLLENIRDPFALEELDKAIRATKTNFRLTKIQEEEYRNVSLHCSYAEKDDFPWGTVIQNGKAVVICKCLNVNCKYFSTCRRDFNQSELNIIQINAALKRQRTLDCKPISIVDNSTSDNIHAKTNNKVSKVIKINTKKYNTKVSKDKFSNTKTKSPFTIKQKASEIDKKPVAANTSNEIVEKLNSQANTKQIDFSSFLEADQDTIIQATVDDRIFVNAGPGTGKTWALIERLIHLVNGQGVESEEIMVLCFSRAAVEVIKERLKREAERDRIGIKWHLIDIRTFDSFATHLLAWVEENKSNLLPKYFELNSFNYNARIMYATDCIKKCKDLIAQCRHLIIDEIQDLVCERAEFVISIINALQSDTGFTLLGDSCQSIYDYQTALNQMDSTHFYDYLFKHTQGVNFYKLTINHRQVSELEKIGNTYRDAILKQANNEINKAMNTVAEKILTLEELDLKSVKQDELIALLGDKKIGILTRTNGQALQISTWLRNSEVSHQIIHRTSDYELADWIATIFCDYENENIDYEQFKLLFNKKIFHMHDCRPYWKAMTKGCNQNKRKLRVSDILKSIVKRGNQKILFTNANDANIIVSNIHKSKGKEYDDVIIIEDLFNMEKPKDIQEHKVNYVAITRAREKVYKVNVGKQFINIDKEGERRSYRTSFSRRGKKTSLSNIEFGLQSDINQEAFAYSAEGQQIIKQLDLVGQSVQLIKNKDLSKDDLVIYDICLEEYEFYKLGLTSAFFYNELERIYKKVLQLPKHKRVYSEVFPQRFTDIYINNINTVIGPANEKLKGAICYDDMMIWFGLSLAGFSHIERDSY